ncbi:MAG: response regulator [Desulfobacteraceae bacterium]|nr:MAG: response regulator [Desulfobacteraceae bacterium]
MSQPRKNDKSVVLIAEDDPDDRFLLEVAFQKFEGDLDFVFVKDGKELMDYLLRPGTNGGPLPEVGLILLDLNMPKIDGRQALLEIKEREDLKDIPIVVWTTSMEDDDREFCAGLGAEGFVTKPFGFDDLDATISHIVKEWLHLSSPE